MTSQIKFEQDFSFKHEIGNKECPNCWFLSALKCNNCGGLVHSEWGDYIDEDEGFYLLYECEDCHSKDHPDLNE